MPLNVRCEKYWTVGKNDMIKVLVIDDEKMTRVAFSDALADGGFAPATAFNWREALELIKRDDYDVVLIDLLMPEKNGIDTMLELKKIKPTTPMIIVTGHGDIASAVEAIKLGAYDYVTKPPDYQRLFLTIQKAIEHCDALEKISALNAAVGVSFEGFYGTEKVMKEIINKISKVAESDFSVIIEGETGTGKTTIARAIHRLSKRSIGPFVVIDMGTIPETLIERELFGHEKGAFTGADKRKPGYFEAAQGGTILIDELQNMSTYTQAKLLRVVEEKKIQTLGSTVPLDVDVRIICATNADLKQEVVEKRFREDLYYRLNEFTITLPPLRERPDDVLFLAKKFIEEACAELNKTSCQLSRDAATVLTEYRWPGNVRELKNVIRRTVLMGCEDAIRPEEIQFLFTNNNDDRKQIAEQIPLRELTALAVRDIERKTIKKVLDSVGGNKSKAAAVLQIDYKTLLTKIKEYGIQ
jgi:two-component system, NtrC family, response regulator AtoC